MAKTHWGVKIFRTKHAAEKSVRFWRGKHYRVKMRKLMNGLYAVVIGNKRS